MPLIGGYMAGESARAVARMHRERAERSLRHAEAFEQGAEGEEATAEVLADLPSEEWRVFHDLRWPGRRYANIDHLAVGPNGVFVVDAKAWSGEIEVRGGVLRQNGRRRERYVASAADAAVAVSELVPGLPAKAVQPVLCFVREEPVFGWSREVMVCSVGNVVSFLTSRPRVLSRDQVHQVAEELSRSLRSAAITAPPKRAYDDDLPPRRSAAAVHEKHTVVRALAAFGVLAAAFALALQLDVFARIGDLSAKTVDQVKTQTEPIGTPVGVPARGDRPALEITAGQPVVRRSTTPGVRPVEAHQLIAVPLTVRNTGDTPWAASDLRAQLTDQEDHTFSSDPAFTNVGAGTALPATFRLRPDATRRGFVVFEVPRGTRTSTVQVSLGSLPAKSVRWSVG